MNDYTTPPPRKRYTLTLQVAFHDDRHLNDLLERFAHDAYMGRFVPGSGMSSSGESWEVAESDDWTPADEYDAALSEWWQNERVVRRSGEARQSRRTPDATT